jgi:glutamine amidotransferase
LSKIEDEAFFYFVHSYHAEVDDPKMIVGEANYGVSYPSVVANGELYGVQFHPEKSQAVGLQLLANFARRVRFNVWD